MKSNADTHTNCATGQDTERLARDLCEAPQYPDECRGLDYHIDEAAGIRIGYVEEINGAGAILSPQFIPTRFELEVIAEHWFTRLLDNGAYYFACRHSGSTELCENAFAHRRLKTLRALIGEGKFSQVVARANAQMAALYGEDFWDDFKTSAD